MEAQKHELKGRCDKNYNVLPVELKLEVIKKIPLHLRWDLAATNKEHYGILCDMDKFKHKLVLTPEHVS